MTTTIGLCIGISLAIVFLFIYIFLRDKEIDRKFRFISAALDNINEEIYILQKNNSSNNIKSLIAEQLEVVTDLILTIKNSELKDRKDIEKLFDKISMLESNIKVMSLSNIKTSSGGISKKDDIEKIKELFEIGYSIEEIAKEVGLPAGEVQLLLKF